jgi:hypothetical protein
MREALLLMPEICELAADEAVYTYREIHERAVKKEIELNELIEKVEAALASDAGRALLERLANSEAQLVAFRASIEDYTQRLVKAEAERVEAFDWEKMCDSGEVDQQFEESRDGVGSMYWYLRDHNMIREAE